MKKKESKYGLLKAVLVMLVLAFVLSWIIPSGAYSSSGFSELGVLRLGIHDIATSIYYGISIGLDKIVLLLVLLARICRWPESGKDWQGREAGYLRRQ